MDPARLRLAATSRALRWALLGLTLLALVPLAWKLFGPRGVVVEVVGKTWQLEIEIEQRVMESGSAWCDELPADAVVLARRRIDKPGAGRPAGAEHCRYSSPQWRRRWGIRNEGQAPTPPRWPEPQLKAAGADGLGAERAGQRQARYLLQLHAADEHAWTCELPLAAWQRAQPGTSFRIQVDRWSVANCASLPAF
jgi:hypothetical protein